MPHENDGGEKSGGENGGGNSGDEGGRGRGQDRKAKRAYVKPEVKRVRLDSEVLLVKGCKMASGSSKFHFSACRGPTQCKNHTPGS